MKSRKIYIVSTENEGFIKILTKAVGMDLILQATIKEFVNIPARTLKDKIAEYKYKVEHEEKSNNLH